MNLQGIKCIIFDLGAVIIDIDVPKTFEAIAKKINRSASEIKSIFDNNQLFELHETGHLSDNDFRNKWRELIDNSLTDSEIDTLWNTLLLQIPNRRVELIKELRKDFKICMLSNTNNIHFIEVENILKRDTSHATFNEFFDKVYLSHEIGLRKPHATIYEYVLKDLNLNANECIFIDDNLPNIESAKALGINAYHLNPKDCVTTLFNK
ncbi:MAG: hypothetical protein RLZZ175_2458 [Bacteroidota bacterium]|jgi:epoxide hydrolase-like predicted phosphatase